jgi:acetylornithine deacetylase/succinyl-diaminopimelate desuccinylase family protein
MFTEIDSQLPEGIQADLVITPVGVGSLAQAVASHYKTPGKNTKIASVEPDNAACLYKSLQAGAITPIATPASSIMAGLYCGTVSTTAWPILKSQIDASVTVSDWEAHEALKSLSVLPHISAGPCGAGTLAALQRLVSDPTSRSHLGLSADSTVVLICSEGPREYTIPLPVDISDPILLTQALVSINSANPDGAGPGERLIAEYIAAWLEHRDITVHWIEPTPGRPSVVGVAKGSGGGKSLILNGHIDTVTLNGYDGDPLSGEIKSDGNLYGRGAADMKAGIATMMVATAQAKALKLSGDVIFTGVADEESLSIGTEDVLSAGWTADGAIVCEPTNNEIITAHKGFVWFEIDILGLASHGSQPKLGIDAISKAGYFLVELDKLAIKLNEQSPVSILGNPSVHSSLITGGEEASSYPAKCTITIEYRLIETETPESIRETIDGILKRLEGEVKDFKYELRTGFSRKPFNIERDHPFVELLANHVAKATNSSKAVFSTGAYWTDTALLYEKGIPAVLFGPKGFGLHSKCEWVEIDSIKEVTDALNGVIAEFCK